MICKKIKYMIARYIGLYLKYLAEKIKYLGKVKFKGFTVLYSFPGSKIEIKDGTVFNSSPLSNLVGLSQRMIIVARHGGKVSIGEECQISGSTIYAMQEITIGKRVFITSIRWRRLKDFPRGPKTLRNSRSASATNALSARTA